MSGWFEVLAQDLRYATRLVRANPMFAAVVVLTLALGIGANTAIFSVMNAVVLRSWPVPDPQKIVYLRTTGWPDGSTQTGAGDSSFPYGVKSRLPRCLRSPKWPYARHPAAARTYRSSSLVLTSPRSMAVSDALSTS